MTRVYIDSSRGLVLFAMTITIAATAGACGDNKLGPNTPASVAITSGSSQTLLVGNRVSAPLVVQVRNSGGSALPNTPVRWAVTSGGGSLSTVEDTTDANGNASTTYLTPAIVAKATVQASAGAQGATFTMTLQPDTVGSISAFAGNGSAGLVGTSLTLVARAADRFGNAMRGVTVNWSTSNGTLQVPTGVTDSTGKTSNVVTIGPDTGKVSVLATSRFNAITFMVSALASP